MISSDRITNLGAVHDARCRGFLSHLVHASMGEKNIAAIDKYASPEWVGQGVDLPGTPSMPWRDRFKLIHRQFCAASPTSLSPSTTR